jgi:monoamine oxidase
VRAGGLSVVPVAEGHLRARAGKLEPADLQWDRLTSVLEQLSAAGPDQSVVSFLDQHSDDPLVAAAAPLLSMYVEGFHAARTDRIGIHALAAAEAGEGSASSEAFRVLEGQSELARLLLAGAPADRIQVQCGALVTRVVWTDEGVEVSFFNQGESGTIRAGACIVALPLGVLQSPPDAAGAVRFEPELTAKATALQRLEMGPVVRLVLRFRELWWPEELSFLHPPATARFGPWWTQAPVITPMLTGWAGGPRAAALAGLSTAELTGLALDELAEMWNIPLGRLQDLLVQAWHHDWTGDRYCRGGYSYGLVGGADAPAELARPLGATMFFAGEATAPGGQNGTVAGAIASGRRAAQELLTA